MYTILLTIVAYLFGNLTSISSFILSLLLLIFGIRRYDIVNRRIINNFDNMSTNRSIHTSVYYDTTDVAHGTIIGLWFIAYVSCDARDMKNYVIYCRSSFINELNQCNVVDNNDITTGVVKSIKSCYKYNSKRDYTQYSIITIFPRIKGPTNEQQFIINDIVKYYNNNNTLSVFIDGPPGTGKSTIGKLLALEFNSKLLNQFNPSEPGDILCLTLDRIRSYEDTATEPLIIVIDEFDVIIGKIHMGMITLNNIRVEVYDKNSYNIYMDNALEFPNIIYVYTSNMPKKIIDEKYSDCYLRQGRINLYYTLNDIYTN